MSRAEKAEPRPEALGVRRREEQAHRTWDAAPNAFANAPISVTLASHFREQSLLRWQDGQAGYKAQADA